MARLSGIHKSLTLFPQKVLETTSCSRQGEVSSLPNLHKLENLMNKAPGRGMAVHAARYGVPGFILRKNMYTHKKSVMVKTCVRVCFKSFTTGLPSY